MGQDAAVDITARLRQRARAGNASAPENLDRLTGPIKELGLESCVLELDT